MAAAGVFAVLRSASTSALTHAASAGTGALDRALELKPARTPPERFDALLRFPCAVRALREPVPRRGTVSTVGSASSAARSRLASAQQTQAGSGTPRQAWASQKSTSRNPSAALSPRSLPLVVEAGSAHSELSAAAAAAAGRVWLVVPSSSAIRRRTPLPLALALPTTAALA